MADWITWFVAAGLVVILELFTGTFYLLMIAMGLAAGGLAALMNASSAFQLMLAALVAIVATFILKRSKIGKLYKTNAARDPNVNLDIGQTLFIEQWNQNEGRATARVKYRGAMWDVQLKPGATPQPGVFTIHEIQGSHLIVSAEGGIPHVSNHS